MASSVTAIGNILENNSGVTALVGQRIYNKRAPDKVEYPCIVYRKFDKKPRPNHDGASTKFNILVRVKCLGGSVDVDPVYRAARAALDDAPSGTYNGVNTTGVQYIDDVDLYEDDTQKDDIRFDVKLFVVE